MNTQLDRVRDFLADGHWRTLQEIAAASSAPLSSVSAQLRHLRKPCFGAYRVEKRRRKPLSGTWEYRLEIGSR